MILSIPSWRYSHLELVRTQVQKLALQGGQYTHVLLMSSRSGWDGITERGEGAMLIV